jgi:O-antigen ligase
VGDVRLNIPQEIVLSPFLIGVLAVVCLIVVLTGRPEWTLGILLSIPSLTRPVLIGPFAAFYLLAATTVLGTVMYIGKRGSLTPLPNHDRWIVLWMAIWWFWGLLLYYTFKPPDGSDRIFVPLILYIIFPMPFMIIFGDQPARINGFATAYIITTMIGAWLTLGLMNITLADIAADPMLDQLAAQGLHNFGLINYHFFAYGTALSIIFAMAIFLQSKNWLWRVLLLLAAAYCGYFLFQAGSRQSIGSMAIVLGIGLIWGVYRGGNMRFSTLLIVVPIALVGVYIYLTAPQLIIRNNEAGLSDAFNLTESRGALWEKAFEFYLSSPIWGWGYLYSVWAHNVFIGALVDQGIVGLIFLIGFLIFLIRRSIGMGATEICIEQEIWRVYLGGVVAFGIVHAQASGGIFSLWYLYWAGALMWSVSRVPQTKAMEAEFVRRNMPPPPPPRVRRTAPTAS